MRRKSQGRVEVGGEICQSWGMRDSRRVSFRSRKPEFFDRRGRFLSMRWLAGLAMVTLAMVALACSNKAPSSSKQQKGAQEKPSTPQVARPSKKAADPQRKVGYDLLRLRPGEQELAPWFEQLFKKSLAEGKRPAVLFSASWCHVCQDLERELGNRHPQGQIGNVRIFELVQEDWEATTRMDEYNELRARWHPEVETYPMLFVLDEKGDKLETMDEAKERLLAAGKEPDFPNWFAGLPALKPSGT